MRTQPLFWIAHRWTEVSRDVSRGRFRIRARKGGGECDRVLEYWILGLGSTPPPPRWSIVRNVLHRVE
jgi:hypothetical protein